MEDQRTPELGTVEIPVQEAKSECLTDQTKLNNVFAYILKTNEDFYSKF